MRSGSFVTRIAWPHRIGPRPEFKIVIYRQRTGCIYTIETDHFQPPFLFLFIPYDQNQIHQVLSSDKVQRINTPIVQLHFRTTTQTNNEQEKSQVLELDKSELETVIASLEEAKEALARLNDTNSKK